MGMLVDGIWQTKPIETDSSGRFVRRESRFRNWVTRDGSPGPSGDGGFKAEPGRYHLYVSYACPWAHRALIMRKLKALEDAIGVSVVHWHMGEDGWTFVPGPGVVQDKVHGARFLREVYTKADPSYTGRVTVPVLYDKQNDTIVNNESSEIIRMLNSEFDQVGAKGGDYYPKDLQNGIDAVNDRVYNAINNGVYACGFARSQAAYDQAAEQLFAELDSLEDTLGRQRYLAGDTFTEADIRLFTTLIRFDPVYHIHFKCSRHRLVEYDNLYGLTREIFQMPGVSETVNFDHIRRHYYGSHDSINPTGIIALMPAMDLYAPHGREALRA